MKKLNLILWITLLSSIVLISCKSSDPLAKQKEIDALDQKVAVSNYVFNARQALPMGANSIALTSQYTLKVTPDTIIAYLPFYGRAYTAVLPSEGGGIKFVSTDFDYKVSDKKKGIYTVNIKIKDNPSNYKISMLIGEGGYTSTHVTQNNKQSISFQGIIE